MIDSNKYILRATVIITIHQLPTAPTSEAGAKPNLLSSKSEKLENPPMPPSPASPKILRNSSSGSMLPWKFSKPAKQPPISSRKQQSHQPDQAVKSSFVFSPPFLLSAHDQLKPTSSLLHTYLLFSFHSTNPVMHLLHV